MKIIIMHDAETNWNVTELDVNYSKNDVVYILNYFVDDSVSISINSMNSQVIRCSNYTVYALVTTFFENNKHGIKLNDY